MRGEKFGDNGTYFAGAISGITDVDAITLCIAKMAMGNEQYNFVPKGHERLIYKSSQPIFTSIVDVSSSALSQRDKIFVAQNEKNVFCVP